MSRTVVHEIKLSKSLTAVLYVLAITLTLNLAKPLIYVPPVFAELGYGDRIEVEITNWPSITEVAGSISVDGSISTCEMCQ
jgi:protein involved in polysaccharide export with SLBB domain